MNGRELTVIILISVSDPFTVRLTLKIPAVSKLCTGFCNVDVFPSPKSQLQELIEEVPTLKSVKATVFP